MSQRTKLKKNRRMNDFIRRYWCQIGKHIVPANKLHLTITTEASQKDWDTKPPSSAMYKCCNDHLAIADLVRYEG